MVGKQYDRREILTNSSALALLSVGATSVASADENYSFEVDILEINTPIFWGEDLEFRVEVTNEGYDKWDQQLRYRVETQGAVENVEDPIGNGGSGLTLDGWESTEQSFSVSTEMNRNDHQINVSVTTEDDSDARTVLFKATKDADVTTGITEMPSEVVETNDFSFNANFANQGHRDAERKYEVTMGDVVLGEGGFELGWEETTNQSISVSADQLSSGTKEITVTVFEETPQGDKVRDTDTESITVLAAPSFEITEAEGDSTYPGSPAQISASVVNNGDVEGQTEVALNIDEIGVASQSLTIGPGETAETVLEVSTDEIEIGEYDGTLTTPNAEEDVTVEIRHPEITIANTETNSPVNPSGNLDVTVTLENNEESQVTDELIVSNDVIGEQAISVSVPAEEPSEEIVTLSDLSSFSEGEFSLQIAIAGQSEEVTFEVSEQAESSDSGNGGGDGGNDGGSSDSDDGAGPGFGVPGAAAGVASLSYLLKKRLSDAEDTDG